MKFSLIFSLLLTFSFKALAQDVMVRDPLAPSKSTKPVPPPVMKKIDLKVIAKEEYNLAKKTARAERKAAMDKFKEAIKAANALPVDQRKSAQEAARKERAQSLLKFHAAIKAAREKLWAALGVSKESSIAIGEPVKNELDKSKDQVQDATEKALAQNETRPEPAAPAVAEAPAPAPAAAIASEASREPSSASRK